MKLRYLFLGLLSLSMISCGSDQTEENLENSSHDSTNVDQNMTEIVRDEHTLSNYFDVRTTHLHLDIEVIFDNKQIVGKVTHNIENINGADKIIFDTKALNIKEVTLNGGEPTTFEMGEVDELLGTPLIVAINENTKTVEITYETTDGTEALDWLVPSQTAGKQKPFMYTQGQSIFTRSWIPLQGTPAIRITYSAKVKVPTDLMAVMSASNPVQKNETGIYEFDMPQPIPCYLLALAVGDLAFAPIDQRTGVYTEPSMLESCAYELADMGNMVTAAEKLYGKYLWDRYDVIVLPPSFPFGGMENPRLTFATPTIIAGDRSLVSLIAHELAHSWSGNLVTNSTWNDFWLNEGFTVYFERRIMESLYGKDYVDMLALLGYQDLVRTMEEEAPDMQTLKLQLMKKHPDDGMTDVAYEKGYFFLRLLEQTAGRDNFDAFLKKYFEEHKFQTITTEEFLVYLNDNLLTPHNITLNVDEWVYGSGIPNNCPQVVSTRFNAVEASLEQFYKTGKVEGSLNAADWSTHEWLHFIRNLRPETTPEQMALIDAKYHLTQTGNSEIAAIWFEQSIKFGYDKIDKELEAFLVKIGRRKFLVPLYTALAATPEGKEKALAIYEKARPNYHYVSYNTIDQLLGLK
ncbi:MAG: M1 family metallopeptidase [Flavobacteriales bacterium]|nr:M1 family metallopeptidase [Flavobacteriales bacterium]